MSGFLKSLRLLTDPTRARLLLLLRQEELSVAEIQQILGKRQSQISTHLAQLKQAGLLDDRREGKNVFYRVRPAHGMDARLFTKVLPVLEAVALEIPEALDDAAALALILEKRRDRVRRYFNDVAGRLGRSYLPGRSWQGITEALLALLPPLVIADLGAGEGTFSQLLARRAEHVIAVDNSERMLQVGAELADKHGLNNLEFRLGDMESLPIENETVDVAFFSQALHHAVHPANAVAEAWRILKPGGRIVILDLTRHQFEQAREIYADVWLGFTEIELRRFAAQAGFENVYSDTVHREAESPHFETLLVVGSKPH